MRTILILWLIPVVLFWGWYGLSYYDVNFGVVFLSRGFHDHIFQIYGSILNMPAHEVPEKLAWIFAIDTLIVFGIAALRWYKHWLPQSVDAVKQVFSGRDRLAEQATFADHVRVAETEINPLANGRVHPAE